MDTFYKLYHAVARLYAPINQPSVVVGTDVQISRGGGEGEEKRAVALSKISPLKLSILEQCADCIQMLNYLQFIGVILDSIMNQD